MKKKMDEVTKTKLIYSGELILFSILFITLGILEIVGIISISDIFLKIFNWVTIASAAYIIGDFCFALVNKKRREKVCMADKYSTIALPFYLIVFDILCFTNNASVIENRGYFIGAAFIYIALSYGFQGVYHWFYPLKELFEDDKKEEAKENVVEEKKEEK